MSSTPRGAPAGWPRCRPAGRRDAKPDDQVRRVVRLDLEEDVVVHHRLDQVLDVVRPRRVVGDQGLERLVHPVGRVERRAQRRVPEVVLGRKVRSSRMPGCGTPPRSRRRSGRPPRSGRGCRPLPAPRSSPPRGSRDLMTSAPSRTCRRPADHEDEVGDRRGVHGAPAHGPMIAEHLGDHPEASVFRRKMSAYPASETTPSWMRAPPESFAHDRDARLEGQVHDLADLLA